MWYIVADKPDQAHFMPKPQIQTTRENKYHSRLFTSSTVRAHVKQLVEAVTDHVWGLPHAILST